jgi:cytochrome c peroxidase
VWELPRGFPQPAVPADNPMSEAKVALGRRLFHETRLSVNGRESCASCHDPARAFTDGRRLAVGATGATTRHNSMALVNVAYNTSFGWAKPNVRSLEEQMLEPLFNEHPVELGLKGREEAVAAELARDPAYAPAFAEAFPGETPVRFDLVVKAIAAYERTLISGDSPFDAYVFRGEHDAMPAAAKRGMALFYSARVGCASCHSGFNFAGNWRDAQGATGEPTFANNGASDGTKMRVPTLRNVALTAPYMHDGKLATLDAVLDHYVSAQLRAFTLTAEERSDLLAFLDSLTDPQFIAREQ